jgi:hypothetical protein
VKIFWLIAAVAGGVVALFFAYRGNYDNAFIAAALGGVAWILNYRTQLKQRMDDDEEDDEEEDS